MTPLPVPTVHGGIMPRPYIYCKWYDTKTYNLLKVLGGIMPPPLLTVNGLTNPICYLLKVAWCPRNYIYCKWSDTSYLLSAEASLMSRLYFYCKWSDTSYLLSAKDGLMPRPISTVNVLTHPTCYLLKVAWCPLYLQLMAWCPYQLSAEGGLIPRLYFCCYWSDTTYLLSAEDGLMTHYYIYCKWSDTSYLLST